MRLGAYDEDGHICDYGSDSCDHYQLFGIEKIIVHGSYNRAVESVSHNIALIRLDRRIHFGSKMKPICLPFRVTEPDIDTRLTVTGWADNMENGAGRAKHAADVPLLDTERCVFLKSSYVYEKLLCAGRLPSEPCKNDVGSPLMYQFSSRRMVLEGIISYGIVLCSERNSPIIYTRVRSYGEWLRHEMKM